MKLIRTKQPVCMVFSAAMLLDEDPQNVIDILGHSGTESVFQDKTLNKGMRGVHIQEIVDLFLNYDKALVRIERQPVLGYKTLNIIDAFDNMEERFWDRVNGNDALLLGSSASGNRHAVAWDGEKVYDPKGLIYDLPSQHFEPMEAWLVYDI